MTTNTAKFAASELGILIQSAPADDRPIIEEFIPEIISLCEKFGKSGQSGGSAPYTAKALSQAIEKLCLQKPICPITGIADEWVNVSELGGSNKSPVYQNKRCGGIFKDGDGEAYYLDAIAWNSTTSGAWSGSAYLPNGERILSRQFIKDFPFTPKTFYIDIIEEEVAPDDWKFHVKDEKQLEEVFNYYKRMN